MANDKIIISGAREHNLKNITVSIPKGSLAVITGPSGSGKSSLALDVLYAEGQRRYLESLSSYARQFLGIPKKPDVDNIQGLAPAIAIDQKTVGHNPRSTVGTITEIYDYLRVLFARVGTPHCPRCMSLVSPATPEDIVTAISQSYPNQLITIVAPVVQDRKGEFAEDLITWYQAGFYRMAIDGTIHHFTHPDHVHAVKLKKTFRHSIDLIVDEIVISKDEEDRLLEAVERAMTIAHGSCAAISNTVNTETQAGRKSFTAARMCTACQISIPEIEPRLFSFNSPIGACTSCHGLGAYIYPGNSDEEAVYSFTCESCKGARLKPEALAVLIDGKNIYKVGELAVHEALAWLQSLRLPTHQAVIAERLIGEITKRYQFLHNVGLEYVTINRSARSLSGGEGQRIRLATQIGSALSGVIYVLDEPSIGLHQRDNDRLIATLKELRDLGNTVVVVEHDHDTMHAADYIIDMGPRAGVHGGTVVAAGTPDEIMRDPLSLTGSYLAKNRSIERIRPLRVPRQWMTIHEATINNLKNIDVKFPLGVFCSVSGVSGSGKSSLVMEELVPALSKSLMSRGAPYQVSKITGIEDVRSLVVIDQSPIGRTSRSNPATYLGIFDDIRKLFAALPESNARGYTASRFSFNLKEGRCPVCDGDGSITVSMHFLPDVITICHGCKGARYNHATLQIRYKDKNIAEVLAMTALEALEFFSAHPTIAKRLQLMCDVGLDYIALGQPSTTLSGGEAQRIKLVDELAKRGKNTVYILDEPTTGLHAHDIARLLQVLDSLVEKGNSVIVIEHNIDVLKTADYIIDLGPEGGIRGGKVVIAGTPAEVAACAESHTGFYLRKELVL